MPDERDTGDSHDAERDGKERLEHGGDATRGRTGDVDHRWGDYAQQQDGRARQTPGERPDSSDKPAKVELTNDPGDVHDNTWASSHIRIEGKKVGAVCVARDVDAKKSEIRALVVEREHRGHGVGSEVLRQVEADEKRRGTGEMSAKLCDLDTDGTEEGRKKLAGFWEHRGYSVERQDGQDPDVFATARKRL
jgi:GNAT superfamily N-acetyltransferase